MKKFLKKAITFAIAAIMVLAMAVPTFAAGVNQATDKAAISVNGLLLRRTGIQLHTISI